jgi:DNA-directed RNA polymerase subunit E'/Rpb7
VQALRKAKIQISELTEIINTSATTRISNELDPKQSLLQDIGKRIDLPIGEDPTIILIEDAEKASKEQAFYSQVIKGDVVVIYPNARKAIIWSPSRMKIVNAGVVDIQSDQAQNSTEATSTTKKKDTL